MMKKLQNYLLIGVFIMTALLAAVAGLRAYSGYMEKRAEEEALFQQRKEEILARNAEAQSRVLEMEVEIIQLQEDVEALQAFIDDTVNAANEVQRRKEIENVPADGADSASENDGAALYDSVSGDDGQEPFDSVSGNGESGQFDSVSGNEAAGQFDSVSGNGGEGQFSSVSGNDDSGFSSVSGNQYDGLSVSGNTVSGNGDMTVSGNDDFGFLMGSISENDGVNYYDGDMTSDSVFDEWRPIYEQSDMTLEERKELRTSYQETLEVNQADREWIAENQYDFSQMKIACLGDSITKAANLEDEENYEQYAYPARLQELLGAQEVYNLGIGGSSIGRYWADAFVDRYMEIPEDSDIIIVMGGTNDGFCVSDEEFGSLEEREYHTFCGDLDELMRGLRENYPDAQIFFATPLPNVLQDYLMSERDYLLPQKKFVEVIQTLADEYDFELIDLYNSNVLDSHDANIITEYMPDGVHGNPEGYQILAERFAGEIVKYYNEDDSETAEESSVTEGIPTSGSGLGIGANTGAAAGVTGNVGAGAGMATVIGGNTGVNTENYGIGTETGDESGGEAEPGGESDGNNEADSGADGDDMEDAAGGTQNGADAGSDGTQDGADAGSDGTQSGTDTGDIIYDEDEEPGGEMDSESGKNESSNGAGADKGIETGDGNDAGSERKQYRYEY
ncbi:MAG: hypothetical protein K2N80_03215 [Lachnospiraceae bacterium]|nr:hypothetical protein [Lachnospiraceae bacterium]